MTDILEQSRRSCAEAMSSYAIQGPLSLPQTGRVKKGSVLKIDPQGAENPDTRMVRQEVYESLCRGYAISCTGHMHPHTRHCTCRLSLKRTLTAIVIIITQSLSH